MDHYAHSLIQGISAAARENNCNLLLGCGFSVTGKSPQHHSFWPVPGEGTDFVPVGPWNTNGLIIVPDELTQEQLHYVRDLLDSGFPVIFTTPEGPGPLVSVDNSYGIRSAFSHLLEHGRKRIAFIAGNPGRGGDSEERLRAYHVALSEAGIPFEPKLIAYGAHRKEGGAIAMQQILDSDQTFDALIASNDLSCIGAIDVLQQAGLRIPEDVAVIGFDDILEARSLSPSLSTVRHPTFSLGFQAVVTLMEYIQGQREGSTKVIVPTRLITRESCGCRPGTLEIQTAHRTENAIIDEMARACFAEARNSSLEDFRVRSAKYLQAFFMSCREKTYEPILDVIEEHIHWTEAHDEDAHIWQAATAVLLENLNNLISFYPELDIVCAALYLDRARQELSEQIQRSTTRAMVGYIHMTSQLGQLTAEMLSAMNIEQTAEILTRHLPEVGIENALVAIYEAGCEDPTSQGTVLFGAGFKDRLNNLSFNPRTFPITGVYPADHPIQLIILPLTIDQDLFGFVAFEAPNPELCAALVHNLSAALRTSRLYQDALAGRKMAEEANLLKSRFLSMVSHELRTPLSLIVGLSEMSLKGKSIEKHDIEQINTSAQHLARLIGDVLDLASSEAGKLRILREPLDLAEVICVAAKIGEELVHEKGLTWNVSLPDQGPWVLGDQTRLRQITLNLISNAVKFTPNGEVRLEIAAAEGEVSVSVSDTGIGINTGDLGKVFNEFYRTERIVEAGIGGMGLGLAVTKQLVEVHGGRITVQSPGRLGRGSTFTYTLPTLALGTMQPDLSVSNTTPGFIVVVLYKKDDPVEHLGNYLRDNGFMVNLINVDEEPEWLSQVLECLPAAIIFGKNLASQNGWSIAGILKHQTGTENIPIFAYSLDQDNNQGEILELNYLHKPIQADQLTKELSRILHETAGTLTVLIVDDDPGILDMHRRMVEGNGKRVVTAHNGREAMEKISLSPPDLILLDLVMPEMDGFAVLDALHASETTRNIPVVILTARLLSDADIERCNRGVASILSKGVFSAEETLGHIEAALTRQSSLNNSTRQLVRRALATIHTRFAEQLTREDIATQLNISADYLTDCFRQEFGITPMTYIRRYRIKQASELLLNSDRSITQVAMNVGFSDSAHFTHTFIREMGMSPKAFRYKGNK
jgi:signal transduction histidine kinase/AraC-like DNA-binding protein